MDVAAKMEEAQILRVAVIDDDFSARITHANLDIVDPLVAALLNDSTDPIRGEYLAALTAAGHDPARIDDLAEPLADLVIRQAAPARLRQAAEAVLEARREQAAPVERVISLLMELGIAGVAIDRYPTPDIPKGKYYDLIVVDYFLVDTRTTETLPFIRRVLDDHNEQPQPLQVILMSSHEEELKANFKTIRPDLGVCGSRMRIMEKPKSDAHLIAWRATLWQLACDRNDISCLERFIRESGTALTAAAKTTAAGLWELDVQAMDLLHEIAAKDNDDYVRYVEDAISRRLLSALESDGGIRPSLNQLDSAFLAHRTANLLAPAAEVGDSRAAIYGLMRSMEWRDGVIASPVFPAGEPVLGRAHWIRKYIRFGMVLLDPSGTNWLNITQACDLAQTKDEDIGRTTVLFIRGENSLPAASPNGDYYVPMSAMMADEENRVLTWNLRDVRAESIQSFSETFGQGWQIVGELRPDMAQSIAAQYGARMARVGRPVTLAAWRLSGTAVQIKDLRDGDPDAPLGGLSLYGHAVRRGKDKPHELHLSQTSLGKLLARHETSLDAGVVGLLTGIAIKLDKQQEVGAKIVCRYCSTSFANAGAARDMLFQANARLQTDERNADKIVVFLWSAP